MKRNIFKFLLITVIIVSILSTVCINCFAENSVTISYDGTVINFEHAPIIVNDRTMVPAEEFFKAINISFEKDANSLKTENFTIIENEQFANSEVLPFSMENILYMPLRAVCEAVGKTVLWNNEERLVSISSQTEPDELSATAMPVKDGKKAAIVFIHDDGGKATGRWLVKTMPKYNINGTVGIIGKSIDPLYNLNEPDNFEKWQVILNDSDGRLNFAVHSHGHRYLGETDEAESGILSDGKEYSYEKGHMTQDIAGERARINKMFPDERLLTFIKPGTLYPEGKTQVSEAAMAMIKEHYIAMRNTGGGVDTLAPEDVYSVKSLMGTASDDYTDTEKNQTVQFWIDSMDEAIERNGMLVYLFHDIAESNARNNTTAQSRVEILFAAMQERMDIGDIWNGKFDEVMQYTQEFNAITDVTALNYPSENYITVKVSDNISKIDTDLVGTKFEGLDMFDYPITVKVEIPYGWEYAKLTQSYNERLEIIKPFEEDGKRYIYANVVPDQEEAIICEAKQEDYITEIMVNGEKISEFEPATFYYKKILSKGADSPEISVDNPSAVIEQANLDENGEGSAFITIGKLRYEVYFCAEKDRKEVILKIDTSKDDEVLTATKEVVEHLYKKGITASIIDKEAYEILKEEFSNVVYNEKTEEDNCAFDFDDEYTENEEGDYTLVYNSFENAFKEVESNRIIMTMHPQKKGDKLFEIFSDQINYLILKNVKFTY